MDQKILTFLKNNKVCSLAIILSDKSSHSAAMHYSHLENPLKFYFSTWKSSKKCQDLLKGEIAKGSMVIGFSEEEWLTLQMSGTIQKLTDENELNLAKKLHYTKHPNAEVYKDDPETVLISFTPNWIRFTDFNTNPETIISMDI